MNKVIALILATLAALVLTSCSGQEESQTENQLQSTVSVAETVPTIEPKETEAFSPIPDAATAEPSAEPKTESVSEDEPGNNILVAYFSRIGNMDFDEDVDAVTSASVNMLDSGTYGNAQLLAQMAQELTGGDLFFIETVEKYPSGYRDTTNRANEEKAEDVRLELVGQVESMDSYETVVLIYPNWWGELPQAVVTFLEECSFDGKAIYPLCTHQGSGLSNTESDIADLCPGAVISDGLSVHGGSAANAQDEVAQWLSALQEE